MGSSPYKNSPKYLFYRPFTKIDKFRQKLVDFTFSLFTLYLFLVDFWRKPGDLNRSALKTAGESLLFFKKIAAEACNTVRFVV